MEEYWIKIDGFDYEISNKGNVKTIERVVMFGNQKRVIKSKILKPYQEKNKYPKVALCKESKHKTFSVHRLVAMYFIANPYNKLEVNHIDGNKANNDYKNLEWNTRQENANHALCNNLYNALKGENAGKAKLTSVMVLEIRNHISIKKLNLREIGQKYKVSRGAIQSIKERKTWNHI